MVRSKGRRRERRKQNESEDEKNERKRGTLGEEAGQIEKVVGK